MYRYLVSTLVFFIVLSECIHASQDTAIVGVEVTSITDINLRNDSYRIQFLVWLKYRNDSLDLLNSFDIIGARSTTKDFIRMDKVGDLNRITAKVSAEMQYDWNMRNFPFISQDIKIKFVNMIYDRRKLVLIADSANSSLNKNLILNDWTVSLFEFKSGSLYSQTGLGSDISGGIDFPAGIMHFRLERTNPTLIIEKILLPVWVAFLVALVVFWIKPVNVDPRFGLPAAGLFASVANKYLISEITVGLPYQIYLETIHNHTYIAILLIIIFSVVSLHYCEKGDETFYKRLDKYCFFTLLGGYVLDNVILFMIAYYA